MLNYNPTISIIIPAYNEEERIVDTITTLKNNVSEAEIIVVDDASQDRTYQLAKECNVRVIRNNKNTGKGESIKKALQLTKSEIIVLLDADLGKSAHEVTKLIEAIKNNEADMAIARFKKLKVKAGFGFVKALSKYGVKLLTNRNIEAALSGQRAIKREVIEKINRIDGGFGVDVGLTIDALRCGFIVKEIDVEMSHRVGKRTLKDFIHRAKQFLDIAKVVIKRII